MLPVEASFLSYENSGFDQSRRNHLSFVDNIDFICLCVAEYEESMSKKIHLDAGILRIHWFDAKAFCTDNADLIIYRSVIF